MGSPSCYSHFPFPFPSASVGKLCIRHFPRYWRSNRQFVEYIGEARSSAAALSCRSGYTCLINPNDHKYIATVWSAYEEVGWQDASSDLHKSLVSRNWRAPDREEMYHIMLASHELSSNRLESQLTTWVAIMALVSALITAYIRTVEQNIRIDNQTAHTIAAVALLFIFIPLVKISGNRLVQVDFDRSSGYRKVAPKSPGLYFRNGNGPCQPAK